MENYFEMFMYEVWFCLCFLNFVSFTCQRLELIDSNHDKYTGEIEPTGVIFMRS